MSAWLVGTNLWFLFDSPAILAASADKGKTWAVVRNEFVYRPQGLTPLGADHLLVWGIKPTITPEKGISHVAEESKDGGKSWGAFRIPQLDYLLGINASEGIIVVSGVRLPKDGLPNDKDWFELPKVNLLSKDGVAFTEIAGPSFFSIGTVVGKSAAPNGQYRAFVSNVSFLDPGFCIYLARTPDSIPAQVLSTPTKPELVWSENSKILALRTEDKFFAYIEVETSQSDKCSVVSRGVRSQKEEETHSEFDKKVRTMLSSNAK